MGKVCCISHSYKNQILRAKAPVGVARTSAPLLLFVDDDAVLGDEYVIERLVAPLLADPSIGVTGASKLLPPDAPKALLRQAVAELADVDVVVGEDVEEAEYDGQAQRKHSIERAIYQAQEQLPEERLDRYAENCSHNDKESVTRLPPVSR